jgi:(2Fe-2S) ferredoxin
MEPFRIHLFVCTQQKPEGVVSCTASGSSAVLERLDHEIQSRGLDNEIQLTTSGCMGLCDEGPVIVVYPAGVWYRRAQASDVPDIVDSHLRAGKTVDRLIWNDPAAMKAMAVEHTQKFRAEVAAREKAAANPSKP